MNRIDIWLKNPHVIDDIVLATFGKNGVPQFTQRCGVKGFQCKESDRQSVGTVTHRTRKGLKQYSSVIHDRKDRLYSPFAPINVQPEHRHRILVLIEQLSL